jgi:histidyl-tRNA synthetase
MAVTIQGPKGTRDFYPDAMAVRRHIEGVWRQASVDCGFDEVEGPTYEHLALYTAKSGPGIVNELFSFRRAGGDDDYALRPEFTPTLARMVAARSGSLPLPVKWFGIPVHFRAERQQRGRLREFVQWNVDLMGVEGAAADAEVIGCAVLAMERLGLKPADIRVRLSHRGAVAAALAAAGVPLERMGEAFELLDRREKLEPAEFDRRAASLGLHADARSRLDGIAATRRPVGRDAPAISTALGVPVETTGGADALARQLASMGLAEWCEWDFGIVRGLAYYTGTVFEMHEAGGNERAVAGGGRYDGLVELFGGPSTPAFGFGMGDVVLGLVLADRGLLPKDATTLLPRPDVFVVTDGSEAAETLQPRLLADLRRAGLHARSNWKATRHVGKLLGDAAKARARFAIILGAELAEGAVSVKDLDGGSQERVAMTELERHLVARCRARGA